MIAIVAVIVAATWAGIVAERRRPGRAGPASRRALTLALYTAVPFIIFLNLARVELAADLGAGVALGWLSLALATATAWAVARYVLRFSRKAVGAVLLCVLVVNTGYLGYPLVIVLLGAEQLSEAVVYDIGVSMPALLIFAFAIGAAFGTRAGEGVGERTRAFFARNPPLYAAIAALVAPDALAPDLLVDVSRVMVILLLPVGFVAVGAALEEGAEEGTLRVPPPLTAPVATVIGARLLLAPALLYLLALPLIDLPDPYLLLAAMPVGLNSMIVAHVYGLDLRITAEAVTWTTTIAIVAALASPLLV